MSTVTLDLLHLIVLLGAIQGLFLTAALAARRSNKTANRLLAAAMLVFALSLATDTYHSAHLEAQFPHFFGIGYPLPFLYGPLTYLYTAAATDRNRRLTPRDWLHFVPFLVVVLGGLPVYLMDGAGKLAFFRWLLAGHQTVLMMFADPLKFVSGLGYGVATLLLLRRHRARVKDNYSSIERVTLRWLAWLGASALGIWALATVLNLLPPLGFAPVARGDDMISVCVAILVCAVGYIGLRQPEIFRFDTAEHPIPRTLLAAQSRTSSEPDLAATPVEPATDEPQSGRYKRPGLSDFEAKRLKERLTAAMEHDRPWTNSELTLGDLASQLSTTPHKLSEVLNSEMGETFYDFVNGYRVREVQRRIAAGDASGLKILALAMDAGFASKSTFNQVFKKHTNQTPTEYRASAAG